MGEKSLQQGEGRCLYEILGVSRESTQEEIRSAYKKLALQLHPDKLISTGVSEPDATAAFQSLLNAYQILSDPRERSWYDSHRSQILFSPSPSPSSSSSTAHHLLDVSDLLPFFSNSSFSGFSNSPKAFFSVYGDIFSKIHAQELSFARELALDLDLVGNAPLIGNLDSPYAQVSAFYSFWLGFSTVLDFSWVDPWNPYGAVPSRKARRVMEDENKKARKKARREFNETVRGLAAFAKKRDKRVIEMQMKRSIEEEKRRAEEKEKKKEELRKKMEKARLYKEPDWARIEEEEELAGDGFKEEEEGDDGKKENELYCVVCSKKFKSEKQWKNHEQSKKHREKVAELKVSFNAEEEAEDGEEDEERVMEDVSDKIHTEDFGSNKQTADNVDDLCGELEDGLGLGEEQLSETKSTSGESDGDKERAQASFVNSGLEEGGDLFGSDEETSILEAMISGRKSKSKTHVPEHQRESSTSGKADGNVSNEESFMEYDNRKTTRRNRRSRKGSAAKSNAGAAEAETNGVQEEKKSDANGSEVQVEKDGADDISSLKESSASFVEKTSTKIPMDRSSDKNHKPSKQSVVRKVAGQRDANVKARGSSKGKKQNATSKTSALTCETCGENFESRNKLHMHLGDTGHAALKFR
ncbi:hypothetical protein AAC387_Pa05g1636 [Persea americana]